MPTEMTNPPATIPISSIAWGKHVKRDAEIEMLADSIAEKGLILPIALSPLDDGTFLLEDGGRRLQAVELLGITHLTHANTCVIGAPGYVVQEHVSSEADSVMTELIANMHRVDPDWREQLRLLVTGWRAFNRAAVLRGEKVYYSTFGKLLGVGHSDINAAVQIYEDVVANPEKYKTCTSIKGAYAKKLEDSKNFLAKVLKERMLGPKPFGQGITTLVAEPSSGIQVSAQSEPSVEATASTALAATVPVIPVRSFFRRCDSLQWMSEMQPSSLDHIVCDPDFALPEERLNASLVNSGKGIAQESVEESLQLLQRFFPLAHRIMRNKGSLVIWMDQEHREKLETWGTAAGFLCQRWMFIWHKNDYNSNAAPMHNLTKDYETAMLFRKPGTTLATYPVKSVFSFPSGNTTKVFGHPFAKPPEVWKKLLTAVALPGERVYDPFMGSGSSIVAGIRHGLRMLGSEIQEQHFDSAMHNLRKEYKASLGEGVRFE